MACRGQSVAVFLYWLMWSECVCAKPLYYKAAVYEHKVVLNPQPWVPQERKAALKHMQKNLDVYEEQTAVAAQQGAQIIVFPEDGIHGFNYTRASIAAYLETVPDPAVVVWSPCADPERFPNTEVLHRLSCMAQKNGLFLVANMPDRQPCNKSVDPLCPLDGQYQFNTNVVFSDNGTIVARYHKQNLFFEKEFDTPPKVEYVTFTTPFAGRFGLFTCFDILFREPVVTLVEMGIRQLAYTTAWMNKLPLLASVHFQSSFSYSRNVTLLAANIREGERMTGSGIYTPWHAVYHYDHVNQSGKLLVSSVQVLDPAVFGDTSRLMPFSGHPKVEIEEVEENKPWSVAQDWNFCQKEDSGCHVAPSSEESTPFYSLMMNDNFTMVLLQGSEGNLTVCNGSLCCHLLFNRSNGSEEELYALGAFNGYHKWYYLEVCALVKCAGQDKESCGAPTEHAQTLVDFQLSGIFTTQYVYAGVMGSGVTVYRPDKSGWEKGGRFYMKRKEMQTGLVTASLYGRVYEKDRKPMT